MVDFRFRKSQWQTNGESICCILERASSSASSAIRGNAVGLLDDYRVVSGQVCRAGAKKRRDASSLCGVLGRTSVPG
jgi:hypothetical protein